MAWSPAEVAAARARALQELNEIELAHGPAARLKHILHRIKVGSGRENSAGRLDSLVYLLAALAHHVKHSCLDRAEVQRIQDDARTILTMERVDLGDPKSSALLSDLYLLASQADRNDGANWSTFWNLQLAVISSKASRSTSKLSLELGVGLRALRLGDITLATQNFLKVEETTDVPSMRFHAALGLVRCLKLARRWEEGQARLQLLSQQIDEAEKFSPEIIWEQICYQAIQSGDLRELSQQTRKKGSHYDPQYIVEGRLWQIAAADQKWFENSARMTTLRADRKLKIHLAGFGYKALCALEMCLDDSYPLEHRIGNLGQFVASHLQFVSIELEMLFFAACARWLMSVKCGELASTVYSHYKYRSLQVSGGRSSDAFNLLQDLERPLNPSIEIPTPTQLRKQA